MMPRGVETNGAAIRTQRFLKGWDQGALADRAGYTMRTIQRAEYGGPVRITTLANIAQALDCAVADLIGQVPGTTLGAPVEPAGSPSLEAEPAGS